MIFAALLNWEAPAAIGAWLACLFFVVALFNQLARAKQNFQGVPTASDVQQEIVKHFTPRADFQQHAERNQKEHDNLFSKVGGVERGLAGRVETMDDEWHRLIETKFSAMIALDHTSRQQLHERINGLDRQVAGMKSSVELQTQHLARMDTKIDRLMERKP